MQTFAFGNTPVTVNRYAQIQGQTLPRVQQVLDNYDPGWYDGTQLIIMEFDWQKPQGHSLVTPILPDEEVRYGCDPRSTAKRHNQQPVPFVLREASLRTKEISIYLCRIQGELQLVRAHFGRPFPPAPFQTSAGNWPGFSAGLLELEPGYEGCLQFWRTHAYKCRSTAHFKLLSTAEPSWII